jgi:sugar phosphate isomerase/epimerase
MHSKQAELTPAAQGPGLFLAQFIAEKPPFNTLRGLGQWAAGLGFAAVQLPTSDAHIFDLERAARSQTYADEVTGTLAEYGLQVSELSTHLQGQLVAVQPARNHQITMVSRRLRCAVMLSLEPNGLSDSFVWRLKPARAWG